MNSFRLGLAAAGFVLAVLSVAIDNHQLGWAAIALLTGSLILRLVWRKRDNEKSDGGGDL